MQPNIFDSEYISGDSTDVEKSEISQVKKFLSEPLSKTEMQQYGISKPTRVIIRGRVAHDESQN